MPTQARSTVVHTWEIHPRSKAISLPVVGTIPPSLSRGMDWRLWSLLLRWEWVPSARALRASVGVDGSDHLTCNPHPLPTVWGPRGSLTLGRVWWYYENIAFKEFIYINCSWLYLPVCQFHHCKCHIMKVPRRMIVLGIMRLRLLLAMRDSMLFPQYFPHIF